MITRRVRQWLQVDTTAGASGIGSIMYVSKLTVIPESLSIGNSDTQTTLSMIREHTWGTPIMERTY